jgi:hypothetical protein
LSGSLLGVFGQHIPLDLSLTCKNNKQKLAGNAAKHTKYVTEIFGIKIRNINLIF